MLKLAAVLGTTFSVADLRLVAHQPVAELARCVEEARRAGVLGEA